MTMSKSPGLFDIGAVHGSREVVDVDRAEQLLSSMSSTDWNDVVAVRLSGKSLTIDAAKFIVASALNLIPVPSIEHADISDIIASRPEHEAKQVLSCLANGLSGHGHTLHTLDVSDNALGLKGVHALAPLLIASRRTLRHIHFNNNGLESRAARHISVLMTGDQPVVINDVEDIVTEEWTDDTNAVPTALTRFHTFNNLLETAGVRGLTRLIRWSPHLNDLRISSTRVDVHGGKYIADAIKTSGAKLICLDLSDNSLMSEGVTEIASALSNQKELQRVNMSATASGDEGVRALCQSLHNSPLTHLDLSCNEITSDGAEHIAQLLDRVTQTLEELKLSENELSSDGAQCIMMSVGSMTRLQLLDLSVNEITASAVKAIVDNCPSSLRRLELNGNLIAQYGLEELQEGLPSTCVLGDMDMNDDEYEEDEDQDEEEEDDEQVELMTSKVKEIEIE